ncbi:MAG: YfiR family protein [Alphaproteobacteria bacterium]|nr:YfiR family protein [Alphaproteobacteria bacterium]
MAFDRQKMRIAAAVTRSLRGLAIAGMAVGMFAVAAASDVRAENLIVTQNAKVNGAVPAEAQTDAATLNREYLIKAAILFNFAKFASWPESAFSYPNAPLRVCVLGDDPFGVALDGLHGKQVRNRSLATARISTVDEAPKCHILFVSGSEEADLPAILDYVAELPILTVGDIRRFANTGGIIALKEVENRSRIDINLGAAEKAGLKLSSKLLRLADTVSTQAAQR